MVKNFNRFLKPYGHFPTEHLASTGKQSDPTLRLVMIPRCRKTIQRSRKTIPRCRKTRWLERVGHGPACAHGDTACFRILTESGIMLWRQSSLAESKCPLSGEFFYAFVRFVLFWISIKFGQSSLVKLSLVKVFSFLELINQKIPHIRDNSRDKRS